MNGYISRGSDDMGLTTVVGRGSDVMNSPSYATLNKFTPAKKIFMLKISCILKDPESTEHQNTLTTLSAGCVCDNNEHCSPLFLFHPLNVRETM
jgi:hypothetical protein